jgi:hypothetical protein
MLTGEYLKCLPVPCVYRFRIRSKVYILFHYCAVAAAALVTAYNELDLDSDFDDSGRAAIMSKRHAEVDDTPNL